MNLLIQKSTPPPASGRVEGKHNSVDSGIRPSLSARTGISKEHPADNSSLEASIVSLKILAGALINRIESLGKGSERPTELNLQREVHRFEAELIRMALKETGGRQRRAARLLGLKATTLSTKIKRHRIPVNGVSTESGPTPPDSSSPHS